MFQAYHAASFLIILDIDVFIQLLQFVVFPPYLRIFELNESILGHESSRAEIPAKSNQSTDLYSCSARIRCPLGHT